MKSDRGNNRRGKTAAKALVSVGPKAVACAGFKVVREAIFAGKIVAAGRRRSESKKVITAPSSEN